MQTSFNQKCLFACLVIFVNLVLDKPCFNAKKVNKTKAANYIKQMYVIHGDVYYFWRDAELKLLEVTQRIEILLAKTKRKSI